jgi:hypothetical protein
MTGPYALFATDASLEQAGILLDYGSFRLRIARAGGGNRKFAQVLEARLKPHRRQIQTETLADELATRLIVEAYAEAVILGWDGVAGPDGAPLPFTRENAVKLMLDLPDLFRDVQEQATKAALFRAAADQDAEKN